MDSLEKHLLTRGPNDEAHTFLPAYRITLAPGVVRYLTIDDFLRAPVEGWIDLLHRLSPQPEIKAPFSSSFSSSGKGICLEAADGLFSGKSWDERLRIHHALGSLYWQSRVPTAVYCCFHSRLGLHDLRAAECVKSWVKEAWEDYDITESFSHSSDHLIVALSDVLSGAILNVLLEHAQCVFRKTPFVLERLGVLEQEAEKRRDEEAAAKEAEDLDRLRKSAYQTFVYLMEDMRNGCFKIGKSRSPGKRERTLQAEVPEIVLRFSIPTDEAYERELHDHLAARRVRGEWFSLTADDVMWMVSFLKRNGDVVRASVDYQWLGKISFTCSNPREPR